MSSCCAGKWKTLHILPSVSISPLYYSTRGVGCSRARWVAMKNASMIMRMFILSQQLIYNIQNKARIVKHILDLVLLVVEAINIIIMNNQNEVQAESEQEPSQIHFDAQLLNRKKAIIQRFIKNEEEAQEELCNYPNQQLKKLAQEHIKTNGRLVIAKSNSSLYFGETCNDLYHGYGLLIYKNAILRFYEGHFQNNCKHGYGLQYINGDIYIGKFLNNKPEDQNGIFIWNNGDIYHGSFVNGMKHGMGKWQSGDEFYSGNWKFNKPEGEGYIKSAISEYNGDVKNGYKHGNGLQIFNNGDRYEGMYSNGKPEGIGTYSWANGSVYKGEFKNGLRFGNGVWQFGTQKYEGSYINDKRNGEGVYTWSGGSYYKGSFVEDLRHGFGQMHWDQGSYYKGQWVEGVQHGEGQVWQNNKLIQKGIFQNGKLKVQSNQRQSQQRPLQNRQPIKKVQTQKNTQLLPTFEDRKRFNSFNNVKQDQFRSQKQRPEKIFHQSFYQKQNQLLLQKKRQINKRYSFLDRYSEKKHFTEAIKFINPKSQQKSVEKDKSKEKEQKSQTKTSLMKIQLYKKLRKQKESSPTNRKPSTKVSKQYQTPMFQTQLQPIRWRNFAHFSSG